MNRLVAIFIALLAVSGLVACKTHGKKLTFKKGEVFYKKPVTKAEATKLGNFLVGLTYLNDRHRTSVQLLKVDGTYQIRFVVKGAVPDDPKVLLGFKSIGPQASGELFGGASVEIHLCNKKLKTLKSLGTFVSYGKKVALDGSEVYYRPPVKKAEAEKLAQVLKKVGYLRKQPKSVQLLRKGAIVQVRFMVDTEAAKKPHIKAAFREIGGKVKRAMVGDGKFVVHLCDIAMNTVAVIGYSD